MAVVCSYQILLPKKEFLPFSQSKKVTNTSKSLRIKKTQMFSQIIDQKEHKNNWYKSVCLFRHQIIPFPHLDYLNSTSDSSTCSGARRHVRVLRVCVCVARVCVQFLRKFALQTWGQKDLWCGKETFWELRSFQIFFARADMETHGIQRQLSLI